MTARPTYGVTVEREGNLWTATVDGMPPGQRVTDAEHFADLEREVRDFVATVLDSETDAFDLVWHYVQGTSEYTPVLEHLREWDARVQDLSTQLAELAPVHDEARAAAIRAMQNAGLSQRAIGDVLGLSHQRIGQLLARYQRAV